MRLSDLHSIILLNDYVVLDAIGPDAQSFLQGQLSCDIDALSGDATFSGYCTANGRLLATGLVWQEPADPSHFRILVHRSLAEALHKRLSMFVLRSKVQLHLSSHRVYGAYETASGERVAQRYRVTTGDNATWVQAPSATQQPNRWWLISDAAPENTVDDASKADTWDAQTLMEGIPHIRVETQDTFIPQTLNLELIGAVSFTKGCFPGQEVVARSHYRGTIRRRSALFSIATDQLGDRPLVVGADLFSASGDDTATGRIINFAKHQDTYWILAEVMLADLEQMNYCLSPSDSTTLTQQALPYDIFEQRENVRVKL